MGEQLKCRPRTMRSLAIVKTREDPSSAHSCVLAIERLRMAQDNYHVPVLEDEIVELFASQGTGVVLDATLGGGGHAAALLAVAPQGRHADHVTIRVRRGYAAVGDGAADLRFPDAPRTD